ncbi:MAG: SEL1-like repeat protein [Verrucomicrobia bacterium]|nr:SEL1-like repeat protein [Verrucomicrobiota bacterium]
MAQKIQPSPKTPLHQVSIEVRYSDLTFGRELGKGGFGTVYQGAWKGSAVAIKKLKINELASEDIKGFRKEAKLMSELRHPHIVSFYKVCTEPGNYCIVLEYCAKGDLHKWLRTPSLEVEGWVHRKRIALEIARGLWYLHSCEPPIIHRDLKGLNVLLDANLQAKISDFGLSKLKLETSLANAGQSDVVGTMRYNPPELLKGEVKQHSTKTDMYSYGLVLLEIATKAFPFAEQRNDAIVSMWIIQGHKEPIPEGVPAPIKALIERCRDESSKRPTAAEAVKILESEISVASVLPSTVASVASETTTSLKTLAPPQLPIVLANPVKPLSAPGSEKGKTSSNKVKENTGDLLNLLLELQNKSEILDDEALSKYLVAKTEEVVTLPDDTPLDAENQKFFNLAKRIIPIGGSYNPSVANMLLRQRKESQAQFSSSSVMLPPPPAGVNTSPSSLWRASLAAGLPPPPVVFGVPSAAPKIPPKPVQSFNLGTPSSVAQYRMDSVLGEEEYQKGSSFKKSGNLVQAFNYYLKAAELGHIEAQFQLSECYINGKGTVQDRKKAEEWCQKAAKQKHLVAQGVCYLWGWGVPRDDKEAVKCFRTAAEQGQLNAQTRLGMCYASGRGVAPDVEEGMKWYRKAAEQGDDSAQYVLGSCYLKGRMVTRNEKEAVKWFRKAVEQGDANAQNSLGLCYLKGQGVAQDYQEAIKWFRKAVEQGNDSAKDSLGICYLKGYGVVQNYQEALKWFREAAEEFDAGAQFNLGLCYLKGQGVARDEKEAVKWFQKAELLNTDAQFNLGLCYLKGQGVARDEKEAVKWFQKAAERDHLEAQTSLGLCYSEGQGVNRNYQEAVKWFRKPAEQGLPDAQTSLGLCYLSGNGVGQDYQEGIKWLRKAAEQGYDTAKRALLTFEGLTKRP